MDRFDCFDMFGRLINRGDFFLYPDEYADRKCFRICKVVDFDYDKGRVIVQSGKWVFEEFRPSSKYGWVEFPERAFVVIKNNIPDDVVRALEEIPEKQDNNENKVDAGRKKEKACRG